MIRRLTQHNLVAFNGIIQPGQRLLKHSDGTFIPVGITGAPTDFYKCVSVDTTNHTWTGYKAYLDNDVYKFEEIITENLSYTNVTPVIDNVYSSDALISAVLYLGFSPDTIFLLDVNTLTDKTGNFTVTKDNSAAMFTTEPGLFNENRLIFPDHGCLLISSKGNESIGGLNDYTIELWYTCLNNNYFETFFPFFGPNQYLTDGNFQFHSGYHGNSISMWQTHTNTIDWYNNSFQIGTTHHVVLSRRISDNNWKCWLDGHAIIDWNYSNGCSNDDMRNIYIGNGYNSSRYNKAAIQDLRISKCIKYTQDNFIPPISPLT